MRVRFRGYFAVDSFDTQPAPLPSGEGTIVSTGRAVAWDCRVKWDDGREMMHILSEIEVLPNAGHQPTPTPPTQSHSHL